MLASWQNILFCFHKLVATHLKNLPPSIKVGIYGFCGNRKAIHVMLSASSKLFTFNHLFLKNFQNTKYELRTHKMTSNGFPCIIPPPIHAVIEYLYSTITMGGQDNGGKYEFEFCRRPPLFQFHYELINGKYSPLQFEPNIINNENIFYITFNIWPIVCFKSLFILWQYLHQYNYACFVSCFSLQANNGRSWSRESLTHIESTLKAAEVFNMMNQTLDRHNKLTTQFKTS